MRKGHFSIVHPADESPNSSLNSSGIIFPNGDRLNGKAIVRTRQGSTAFTSPPPAGRGSSSHSPNSTKL
ncbi:hypothetical protein SAY87_030566 [Trapa incisa]|uniref:Uncharacterized protein n=1 Tax=Trapa incisa TaxID=236973 RepID=A0AAN7KPN9_9MYRT|nr:hypothetical protein SAY87_030566 [Trapa incisa]